MKKFLLALGAALICTISMAQPPMGGGGFPGGGFPGGGFPGGGFPMMGMFGMDASNYSSVDVAKAQTESFTSMLDLTPKQAKKIYRVELKVADERYMDLLKNNSNGSNRRGGFGGGFPGGGFPGGGPGMGPGGPGGPGGERPEGAPEGEGPQFGQNGDNMSTSEDMLADVELLKKYDGMRLKKFGKILTPEQMEKWENYKTVRYERAARAAERAAARAAREAAGEGAADGQRPQRPDGQPRQGPAPAGN